MTVDFAQFFCAGSDLDRRTREALSGEIDPATLVELKRERKALADKLAAETISATDLRWATAERERGLCSVLEAAITGDLHHLRMAGGNFLCAVDYKETSDLSHYSNYEVGMAVEFESLGKDSFCVQMRSWAALCDQIAVRR